MMDFVTGKTLTFAPAAIPPECQVPMCQVPMPHFSARVLRSPKPLLCYICPKPNDPCPPPSLEIPSPSITQSLKAIFLQGVTVIIFSSSQTNCNPVISQSI